MKSKEERKRVKKQYADAHKEETREYTKQWRLDNDKRIKKKNEEYRENNTQKIKDYGKEYNIINKEVRKQKRDTKKVVHREYLLIQKYNITLEQYNELFIKQKGCCAICEKHQTELTQTLNVDHDHMTGKIRGLLCMKCNRHLGGFNDDIKLLIRATEYLKTNT